ncbi:MAG: M20/M25/M40 family metallo-hydrolase [Anaerococcus sp.]|nr:M20/M25/M40 family metallo-hydrolase [Anaerococcus sp.]
MKEKISEMAESLLDDLIEDLRSLLVIESKKSDPCRDYPYGINCGRVLERALEIGQAHGFSTKNIDNRMAYCSIGKENNNGYICAMGHLDVVEEMDGRYYPPFKGEIHNNRIYARGALDNKGPIMAAFYGLIVLKKLGINFNREFRIIFGADEESGMSDLEYYLSKEKPPLAGFTPDNKFPAIYGERARARIEVSGSNEKMEEFINTKIFVGDPVTNLGIDFADEDFGKMILRGKKLSRRDYEYIFSFTLATPKCDIDEVIGSIKKKAPGLNVKLLDYKKWMERDKTSSLVKILNESYNYMMDDEATPTSTTGMTYAHFCPNIIPFGPSFPGQNGIAHLPNEWMDLDDLFSLVKIYAYAFYRLNEYYK